MNVLLLCSQGMSTGMLCDRIAAAAKEDGCEMTVWAASEIKAREHVGKADIILLGPQVRYLKNRIAELAEGKPVEVIDMMAYGMMDGKKVYHDIKKRMGDK
ncbi:PTS sugar transporter subunit IIB [Agathobaculum desmolans]|uniref:PTS sugar transporter subunit IIB n=1 Tax=Agathobaculum desmolans TaxID=39484 RepID=UPI0004E27C96|nr:PTS sugar transporter subunit IIB [Agathobaculum desmolans]